MVDNYALSYHEILTKVNNAKDKPKKLEVLRRYDTKELRSFLKGAFDPNLVWLLPEGKPPYTPNDAPIGTEHTWLKQEVKRMFHFLQGGNTELSQSKRDNMFIQMLEGLSAEEADLLIKAKDKALNKEYKGLTGNLVKEAFDWDDSFMRKNSTIH
mgnify:FL=1|jgi:hypothetical protein|tara:strand:- start:62 stop:526 length:465 start_codon:yes stop_codon:yes gene_type:complete